MNFETVVNLIASTKTRTALRVKASLDTTTYEKGQAIPDEVMEKLALKPHAFHPEWNYTLNAQS